MEAGIITLEDRDMGKEENPKKTRNFFPHLYILRKR
jgi:hypothetical protein